MTKLITKKQYKKYLKEVEKLIKIFPEVEPKSKEGKRLNKLAILVEAYEKINFPILGGIKKK